VCKLDSWAHILWVLSLGLKTGYDSLRGYAPYARGLQSGPAEGIILRMAHKWKLANNLTYSEHWINFCIIYYPLYMLIMPVDHDFGRMRDFGRMPNSDRKIRLQSYISTLVALLDSGRCHNFRHISWLRSRITTLVNEHATCLTTSAMKDFAWLGYITASSYSPET
jgi:hypothetical protein